MSLLDKRLFTITEMILKGEPVADIGADHALLSIYMVENNIVPRAIVTDLPDGPYNRAADAVKNNHCVNRIDVRQGNGLQVLNPGEVSSVIIAGMGGGTIVEILSHDWYKAATYKRFVFQPMSRADVLRRELSRQGWPILDERLVWENQKYFVIISVCPGERPYKLSSLETEVGPVILKGTSQLNHRYLEDYLRKYTVVYNNLLNSRQADRDILLENYHSRIKELEEVLSAGEGQGC